jgi:ubiquinol-cytochrome c reductase iron-sulfur subunit
VNRRKLLNIATSVIGGVGAYASSITFIKSFFPSAKALGFGEPVEIDLAQLGPGEVKALETGAV